MVTDGFLIISGIIYWDTMFGHSMLVFLFGAFRQFSSVVFFFNVVLVFHRFSSCEDFR